VGVGDGDERFDEVPHVAACSTNLLWKRARTTRANGTPDQLESFRDSAEDLREIVGGAEAPHVSAARPERPANSPSENDKHLRTRRWLPRLHASKGQEAQTGKWQWGNDGQLGTA